MEVNGVRVEDDIVITETGMVNYAAKVCIDMRGMM